MQVPLLVGARPRFASRGPEVDLGDGHWLVYSVNRRDTEFWINGIDADGVVLRFKLNGKPFPIDGPVRVYIEFDKRGSEDYVSVFAELTK